MKKILLIIGVIVAIPCAHIIGRPILTAIDTTIHKYSNVDLVVIDPSDSIPPQPCQTCPAGPAGRGISNTIVDPITGVMIITYSDGTKYVSPSLKGPKGDTAPPMPVTAGTTTMVPYGSPARVTGVPVNNGTGLRLDFEIPNGQGAQPCTGCTGGGTQTKSVFDVTLYNAKGDGVTDDTQAIQNCFNAALAARGKVLIPSPTNFYKVTSTITVQSGAQTWINVEGWGRGNGTETIRYMGPSGKAVFLLIGIKQQLWTSVNIGIAPGLSGVTLFDIDTRISGNANSSTGSTFKSMYLSLGDGVNNVAFRMGHLTEGHGDIANLQWENVAVYGSRKQGQVAYLIEGQNALSQTWQGCFVAQCHKAISNNANPGTGATKDRGNGSLFIFGLGCSQNILDFDFNFEQSYIIMGGRFEGSSLAGPTAALSGSKFLNVGPHSYNAAVTVVGAHISEYNPPDGALMTLGTGGSLNLIGVQGFKTANVYNPAVALNGNGMKGTLMIDGGAFSAVKGNLFRKTGGATVFKVYIRGASKYNGGVYTDDWFDDVNGQQY